MKESKQLLELKLKKQLLELKLKNKYHYIWDNLISKSKLELIDLLCDRDERIDQKHRDDEWHGDAIIKVYAGDKELKHTVKISAEETPHGLSKDAAFECARQLQAQYIDWTDTRTEVLFTENYEEL